MEYYQVVHEWFDEEGREREEGGGGWVLIKSFLLEVSIVHAPSCSSNPSLRSGALSLPTDVLLNLQNIISMESSINMPVFDLSHLYKVIA